MFKSSNLPKYKHSITHGFIITFLPHVRPHLKNPTWPSGPTESTWTHIILRSQKTKSRSLSLSLSLSLSPSPKIRVPTQKQFSILFFCSLSLWYTNTTQYFFSSENIVVFFFFNFIIIFNLFSFGSREKLKQKEEN